jgi:AraC family transcriptional regulator
MAGSPTRVKFHGEALTSQEVSDLQVNEREVAGLYLKESAYPPGFRVPKHSHVHPSFYLAVRGTSTEILGSNRWECKPLSLVFTPAGEVHSEQYHNSGGRAFIFEIAPAQLDRLHQHSVRLDQAGSYPVGLPAWLAIKLYREYRQMDQLSPLIIEGLALEIIAEVTRREFRSERRPPQWLLQARDLLHAEFSRHLTLNDIAKAVGIHPVHLATMFRQHYRQTVGEYVRQRRIEYACGELSTSDAPVVDIALAAGFFDQGHFSKTFKRFTGISPASFRATMRSS